MLKSKLPFISLLLIVLVGIAFGQIQQRPGIVFSPASTEKAGEKHTEKLQCANLIYGGTKSSKCFSYKFLEVVRQETNCEPELGFTPVKLASEDIYKFPFSIMTGEGAFSLLETERKNLRSYLTRGGFLLVSAGCSSKPWNQSFRTEIKKVFPKNDLVKIKMDHPIFHTVFDITRIQLKKGTAAYLEGLVIDGKIVLVYSQEGLNDTPDVKGCCCCGGNEVRNSKEINVNVFTYALTH